MKDYGNELKCVVGNEIELGIGYRRSDLRQVKYQSDKGIGLSIYGSPTVRGYPGGYCPHPGPANNHCPRVSRSCPENSRTDRETHLRCR